MNDILQLHKKGVDTTSPFLHPPVLVLNNFPTNDKPLELVVKTFQNMFPAMNPEKVYIDHCRRVLLLQYDSVSLRFLFEAGHPKHSPSSLLRRSFRRGHQPRRGHHREQAPRSEPQRPSRHFRVPLSHLLNVDTSPICTTTTCSTMIRCCRSAR